MRRLIAYLVMMLTIIGCFVFNIQTVLEDKNDGMEFDRATQLVFSLEKRESTDYDSELYPDMMTNPPSDLADIDIEDEIMARLDLAGVRNAEVSIVQGEEVDDIEQGYQLRITFNPYSETELNNVIDIVSRTGSLSVATVGDQTIMTQENSSFFADSVASLVYDGTTPYPTINIGDDQDFQTMKTAAEEAATNLGETGSSDSDTSEDETADSSESTDEGDDQSTSLYIWYNKTLEDTYDKAYGTNDTVVDQDVLNKVVAVLNVSDYDSENHTISITSDKDGNAFTISTARALVNLLNAQDYGFDINYLYSNRVSPVLGTAALNSTYLAIGIVYLAVAILLILFYGLSGLTAATTLLGSIFLTLVLSSALGFEFSISSLLGLIVVAALSLFLSCNYFEHVKNELKKGRGNEKSNQEGYHKSFFLSLDVSVIFFAVSLFSFLLATGSFQVFFGVSMIGSIVTFLLTNYFNRFLTYFLVKSNDKKLPYFRLFNSSKKEEKPIEKKYNKRFNVGMIVIPAVACLALAISLPVNSAMQDSFFNNADNYQNTYTLNISFITEREAYQPLDNTASFLLYLETIGDGEQAREDERFTAISSEDIPDQMPEYSFIYYPETAFVNTVEKTSEDNTTYFINYYSVSVDRDLSSMQLANQDQDVMSVINEAITSREVTIDLDPDTNYSKVLVAPGQTGNYRLNSLEAGCYLTTPTNIAHSTDNFFLIVFLMSVFAAIYALLRYGLNMGLTTLVSGSVAATLFVGLMAALQIPFNSYTAFGALVGLFVFFIALIPPLYTNHITIKENNLRYIDDLNAKADVVDDSFHRLIKASVITVLLTIVFSLSFFFIAGQLLGLSFSLVIFLLLVLPISIFFGVVFYFFLYQHLSFKKMHDRYLSFRAKRKEERQASKDGITYVDPDSPHETIIPGLNDFLH